MSIKIIISRIPISYQIWKKIGLFRHGSMDNSDYSFAIFDSHLKSLDVNYNIKDKVILELGPGDSIATAIIAVTYGAKAILVDVGNYLKEDVKIYKNLVTTLKNKGLNPPNIDNCKTINDILETCNANYYTDGVNSLKKIYPETIDIIFSQAVLEHVWKHEFLPLMKECKRILNKKGIASHRVDLRDHLGGGLNNLRFNDKIWESKFFVNSGFYTNRIRFKQMDNLFKQAGFNPYYTKIEKWKTLPISINKLNKIFQSDPDDLLISGFNVILN